MFRTLRFYHSFFKFLSTPSARRATEELEKKIEEFFISIHALREEGDLTQCCQPWVVVGISIHALREESDWVLHRKNRSRKKFLSTPSARRATNIPAGAYQNGEFLSTPSARRATKLWGRSCRFHLISIHALREESDLLHLFIQPSRPLFLSTPSARRATPLLTLPCIWCYISIHALREESDVGGGQFYATTDQFLSTPSARRATA